MRRRLVGTYLALLALVLLALEIPLSATIAARLTDRVVVDRLLDANRIAAVAEPALREGRVAALTAELDRYHELYGISSAVADRDATFIVVGGPVGTVHVAETGTRLRQALAGERAGGDRTVWPWRARPIVVAVPVTSGAEVIGAVVTVSPTGKVRGAVLRALLVEAVVGAVALALFVAVASWMASWILRPVAELAAGIQAAAAGDLGAETPADAGPPELRRLTRSFNDMAASLADAIGRQRAFVAQASHQLRNPLTALRIRVENLAPYIVAAGRQEHRQVLEDTDRLGKILEGLLALARAEGERHPVVEVDAGTVLDERVAAWQPLAAQRAVTLRRAGEASAGVLAVETGVDQAVDALVDNALKFAGPGAGVTVRLVVAPSGVEVHVTDTGPGLTEAECRLAVQRLWRAPTAQNVAGAGLGLPIAAVLMAASGGELLLYPVEPAGLDAVLRFQPAAGTAAAWAG